MSATKLDPKQRLMEALALKNYAISKGNTVSDNILETLNNAERDFRKGEDIIGYGVAIDKAISELTTATYPTTGESLLLTEHPPRSVRQFRYALPALMVVALVGAIAGYASRTQPVWASVLAVSLGLLGAVIYQIFNIIGVLREKAFSIEDVYANALRILLGPAVGWVFYFAFSRDALTASPPTAGGGNPAEQPGVALLLLPFLAGFSTKLVVGILDKAIQSIMLIFGIEDKRTDILVRQRRHQETAVAIPPGGDQASTPRKDSAKLSSNAVAKTDADSASDDTSEDKGST